MAMSPSIRRYIRLSDGVNICAVLVQHQAEVNERRYSCKYQRYILTFSGHDPGELLVCCALSRLILVESIVAQIHISTRRPWPTPNGSQLSMRT